jgi:hypothetical protein
MAYERARVRAMRTLSIVILLMSLSAIAVGAQNLVPPEVVRLEKVKVYGDLKTVYLGNANAHYILNCNIKAAGCITPTANKNYLLFTKDTRWKMPGAKDFINLKFVQGWTVTYQDGENIGLVPEEVGGPDTLGMFFLSEYAPR